MELQTTLTTNKQVIFLTGLSFSFYVPFFFAEQLLCNFNIKLAHNTQAFHMKLHFCWANSQRQT